MKSKNLIKPFSTQPSQRTGGNGGTIRCMMNAPPHGYSNPPLHPQTRGASHGHLIGLNTQQ